MAGSLSIVLSIVHKTIPLTLLHVSFVTTCVGESAPIPQLKDWDSQSEVTQSRLRSWEETWELIAFPVCCRALSWPSADGSESLETPPSPGFWCHFREHSSALPLETHSDWRKLKRENSPQARSWGTRCQLPHSHRHLSVRHSPFLCQLNPIPGGIVFLSGSLFSHTVSVH